MSAMAAWQGLQNDSISAGNTRWLMIFVGIVAFSMAAQAIVVIFAAVAARRTQIRVLAIAEEMRAKATPIMEKAENLVDLAVPKIHIISDNLVATSKVVRAKAEEFDVTLTDVNVKTRAQVARVDGMVSAALSSTSALGEMVHKGIRTPMVELAGLVNGFKAGIDVLFSKTKAAPKPVAVTRYKRSSDEL